MNNIRITRVKVLDVLLFIAITLFSFSCLFTLFYNENVNLVKKLSNNFYDDNALFFKTSKTELDFTSLYEALPNDTVLFGRFYGQGEDIRGVIYKGDYVPPNLISGRFFSESDFISNSHVAVIGKDVPINKTINEKKYVEYNHMDYEVIGIIGYNIPTRIDRTILLNLNADNITSSVEYIVSSSTIQNGLNFIGNEKMFGQVSVYDKENVNILHIIDRGNNQVITSIIFIFVLFVNSLSVMIFWNEKKNTEMKIKWSNGYTKKKILIDVWKDFFPILLLSLISALGSSWFFGKYMHDVELSLQPAMLGATILLLLFSFLVIVISYIKMRQR
ncbi:hypothetical protein PPYC1_16235 [Paenibacillus polymyxa]|uniref:ABC transporter permease n=1 Tax=Paenibacillus polymyxa TaxID=1406 RepID=UPI0008FBB060|nr:ABC transporter permease [Paenibacillus polymyxa]APB71819.1 hypothetical protein PPYC1_16235 [Paenibacillus polymyxa]APB76447.1 hypothetical protein PPYC2_16415 [Paenibacillus polymyxa]